MMEMICCRNPSVHSRLNGLITAVSGYPDQKGGKHDPDCCFKAEESCGNIRMQNEDRQY